MIKLFFLLLLIGIYTSCKTVGKGSKLTADQQKLADKYTSNGTTLGSYSTLNEVITEAVSSPTVCENASEEPSTTIDALALAPTTTAAAPTSSAPAPSPSTAAPIAPPATNSDLSAIGHDDLIDPAELSPKCNIVLVRHGERPSGNDCLTSKGQNQADNVNKYLEGLTSSSGALGGDFDVFFKSNQKRVHNTMGPFQRFMEQKSSQMITNPNGPSDGEDFEECFSSSCVNNAKRKILEACSKPKAGGGPQNILIGGHGEHFNYLIKALTGERHEYPHHAEPYIFGLEPNDGSTKFKKIQPRRNLQANRTYSNPKGASCN